MRPRNRVSSVGLDLVKRFEGYRRQAAQLPDGRWTIGYGHTLTAREGAQVSEADAEALLQYDLHSAAKAVDELVFIPLSQNQFDALCSFAFNLGADEFRGSDVLKRLNEGGLVQAACAMEMWRKAEFEGEEIVVDALVRRRAAEKILFLTPPGDAFVPAPSPVLRPRIDPGADDRVPADTPTQLATSLYGTSVVVTRGVAPPPEPEPGPELPPQPEPEPEPELEPELEHEFFAEPEPQPAAEPTVDRVTAAAEAVTARLETLFADPPAFEPEPEIESGLDVASEAEAEPAPEADEAAFIEAFIEAGPDPQPAEPEQAEPPQKITPFVVSYPAAAAPAPSTFQPSFGGPSAFAPIGTPEPVTPEPEAGEPEVQAFEPEVTEPEATEPEPEVELHAEPEPAEVVAEPIDDDEDDPPLSFEPPDSDLWGDDEPYVAPPMDAEPEPSDETEDFELPPAAQVAPPRALEDEDVDAFTRRPQFEAPQTPEPSRDRTPFAVESPPVRDFLPSRPAPRVERTREPGLLTDLFLALLGIAFFGFAVFWALNAKVDPAGPGIHPSLIAWPTGFIGIGFVVVAIFRLLERLGDAAERD